jgi:hypothetical protein
MSHRGMCVATQIRPPLRLRFSVEVNSEKVQAAKAMTLQLHVAAAAREGAATLLVDTPALASDPVLLAAGHPNHSSSSTPLLSWGATVPSQTTHSKVALHASRAC